MLTANVADYVVVGASLCSASAASCGTESIVGMAIKLESLAPSNRSKILRLYPDRSAAAADDISAYSLNVFSPEEPDP